MKLNATQVNQALMQMNAQVLPDDHPAVGKLNELFGHHTFFVDESGLKVLESTGSVVSLADWTDGASGTLKPHTPAPTGEVVALDGSQR